MDKSIIKQTLQNELEIVPKFTMFGDNNHLQINQAINFLDGHSKDTIEDTLYKYGLYDDDEISNVMSFIESIEYVISGEEKLEDVIWNTDSIPSENKISVCKKLCNDCPFSNQSTAGFLAEYSINDFVEFQRHDILFPCHKMVKEDTTVQDVQSRIKNGEMKLCRGYVESMAKSCKKPKDRKFSEIVESVKDDMSGHSMSIYDFRRFHDTEFDKYCKIREYTKINNVESWIHTTPNPETLSIDEICEDWQIRMSKGVNMLEIMREVYRMLSSSYFTDNIPDYEFKNLLTQLNDVSNLENQDDYYDHFRVILTKAKF